MAGKRQRKRIAQIDNKLEKGTPNNPLDSASKKQKEQDKFGNNPRGKRAAKNKTQLKGNSPTTTPQSTVDDGSDTERPTDLGKRMLLVDKKDFLTDKDSLFISEEDSPNMPFVPNRKRQRNSSADSFSTHIVSKRGRIDSDSDNE